MQKLTDMMAANPLFWVASTALLVLLVMLIAGLWLRRRVEQSAFQAGQDTRQTEVHDARERLARLEEELKRNEARVLALSTRESSLQERVHNLQQDSARLETLEVELKRVNTERSVLRTRLEELLERHREQKEFLRQSEDLFKQQFHRLAEKVLDDKSDKFTAQNRHNLDLLLKPLSKQIEGFQKLVNDSSAKGHAQFEVLQHELTNLRALNMNISEEARNLTRALKAESKTQGNWGELVLQRVLEASGLQQGREYEVEKHLVGADNSRYRPDVIIHLPKNKDRIIDAKVSLTAYEQYINCEEGDRAKHLDAHIASLQAHVKSLSGKDYQNIEGLRTVDFVLMFVPVEAAYLEAMNAKPQLFEEAFKKNILMLSTSNLLATLRTVALLWQNEDQNANALKIAQQAGLMYDKLVGFTDDLSAIKTRLDQADEAWHAAENKLKSGRGNLIGKAEMLKKLGARASKALPDDWQSERLTAEKDAKE